LTEFSSAGALGRRVYANASPLIALACIGRLDLLTILPTPMCVTSSVWREVTRGTNQRGVLLLQRAEQNGLLIVMNEGSPADYPQLAEGEASTLSAALAAQAAILIDERKATSMVQSDEALRAGIPLCFGTLALILEARRQGRIDRVRPMLSALRRAGFRLSRTLYDDALRAAGER
jgi:uncharacterized protein